LGSPARWRGVKAAAE